MEPVKLEYHRPGPSKFFWADVWRIFFLGPFTGALMGFVQTLADVMVWMQCSKPDFYFRGWSGVRFDLVCTSIAGAIVGVPYGLVLKWYEQRSGNRVRVLVTLPALLGISFVAAMAIARGQFARRQIEWPLLPQVIAIVFGALLSVAISRGPVLVAPDTHAA